MSVTQLRDGLVRVTISKGHFVQGMQYPRKFGQGHIGRGLCTLHLLHSDNSIAVPVRMLGVPVLEGMVASDMKGTYSLRQIKGLALWRWGLLFHRIKGTVSRDFLLLVFFMNQFPPSP
jgi:hypothetical protein